MGEGKLKVDYYCINLPSAIARRETISQQASAAGIEIIFVEAVLGSDVDVESCKYYDRKRRLKYDDDLFPNEVACFLSHRKALIDFYNSSADYAVVLEDDAGFDSDMPQKVQELINKVQGFDALNLYKENCGSVLKKCVDLDFASILVHSKLTFRAVGYLYTKKGVAKLLTSLDNFYQPIDTHIGFSWRYNLTLAGVEPSIIQHRDHKQSTIGDRENSQRFSLKNKVNCRLERVAESLSKRLWAFVVAARIQLKK